MSRLAHWFKSLTGQTEVGRPENVSPVSTQSDQQGVQVSSSSSESQNKLDTVNRARPCQTTRGSDEPRFKLKAMEFWSVKEGRYQWRQIILQNENGPCSLLALCNALLLRGDMQLSSERNSIRATALIQLLGESLLNLAGSNEASKDAVLPADLIFTVLPMMQYGLDANPCFDCIDKFAIDLNDPKDAANAIFSFAKVPLFHCWTVDPQDKSNWSALVERAGNYNEAVAIAARLLDADDSLSSEGNGEERVSGSDEKEHALQIHDFLRNTSSQMTYDGLFQLNAAVTEETPLAILFRANHFSVVYRPPREALDHTAHPGIHLLVTDSTFVNEESVIYEALEDVDQSAASFFDSRFHRASLVGGDYVIDLRLCDTQRFRPRYSMQRSLNFEIKHTRKLLPSKNDKGDATQRMSKLVPPLNFAMFEAGVFRSGHPNSMSWAFLQGLRLRSILYLADDDLRDWLKEWAHENKLKVLHCRVQSNHEPFVNMDEEIITKALHQVLDTRNHPMLVFCNKGMHRVGCLFAVVRRLQGWSMSSVLAEYTRFAGAGSRGVGGRVGDQEFIEFFDREIRYDERFKPVWLVPESDRSEIEYL